MERREAKEILASLTHFECNIHEALRVVIGCLKNESNDTEDYIRVREKTSISNNIIKSLTSSLWFSFSNANDVTITIIMMVIMMMLMMIIILETYAGLT